MQGILPLNGDVYVTGVGPQGHGLYCLSDQDRDGTLEAVKLLFNFEGEMGEQTAHGLVLGPDGWIYVVLGVYTSPLKEYDAASPHRGYYEGDLVGPRYEDPGGHAVGRKAPGGMIIRTDLQGERGPARGGRPAECVRPGLQSRGRVVHSRQRHGVRHRHDLVPADASVPHSARRRIRLAQRLGQLAGVLRGHAALDRRHGRSSPTGAVFYNHVMFPEPYRNALFLGDWSEGRILVAHLTPNGASYTASVETFLVGPAVECDRSGRRSRRLAVLRHRRTRHGRRPVSRHVDGARAGEPDAIWARASRRPSGNRNSPACLGPPASGQSAAAAGRRLGADADWAWRAARPIPLLTAPGAGPDATLRSVAQTCAARWNCRATRTKSCGPRRPR